MQKMPIVDPVTTYNSWLPSPAPAGTITSLRGIVDVDEGRNSGIRAAEFSKAWRKRLADVNPFSVVSDGEAMADSIPEDLTRSRCASATVYAKKTSNANIDDYARDNPPQKTEEPLAEDEELHLTFWRRSAGILKRYGQDLLLRQRVEV